MICLRHSDVLRLYRKVMRCVPLPSRALAHITSGGYITHEVYITFRGSGTHRAKKSDCLIDKSLFFDGGDGWDRTNDLMHVKHAL